MAKGRKATGNTVAPDTLAGVEAAEDARPARDPATAMDRLADDAESTHSPEDGIRTPKAETVARTKARRKAGRPRYEDLQRERDALAAQVAATGAVAQVDPNAVAQSLAATFDMIANMAVAMGYTAVRVKEEDTQKLGAIWGPLLAPYVDQLGAYAPFAMATAQTAAIMWPYFKEHKRVAGAESVDHELVGIEIQPTAGSVPIV